MARRLMIMAPAALLLALTACGGGGDGAPASGGAPSSAKPSGPVAYGSVEDLKDAAVDAGYVCKNWHITNKVALAAESGNCDANSVLSTYASDQDLQDQLDQEKATNQLLLEADIETTPVLVGPNWLFKAPEAVDLRESLGGILIGAKK